MSPPTTHTKTIDPASVRWSTVLKPYRSTDHTPVFLIFALVAGTFFVAGVAFSAMGAWPVFGFLGLDIVALFAALRLNQKRATAREALTLTDSELLIDRVDHWGRHRQWSVPPHWLKVEVAESDRSQPRLELRTHGRIWTIAKFLHADEKKRLAAEIRLALGRLGPPPEDLRSFD